MVHGEGVHHGGRSRRLRYGSRGDGAKEIRVVDGQVPALAARVGRAGGARRFREKDGRESAQWDQRQWWGILFAINLLGVQWTHALHQVGSH